MKIYRLKIGEGRVTTNVTVQAENEEQAKLKAKEYDGRKIIKIKEL